MDHTAQSGVASVQFRYECRVHSGISLEVDGINNSYADFKQRLGHTPKSESTTKATKHGDCLHLHSPVFGISQIWDLSGNHLLVTSDY